VHHQDGGEAAELDGKIAIGNRIETVAGDPAEAELLRHPLAVDREGGAGQRPGAERQQIEAGAQIT